MQDDPHWVRVADIRVPRYAPLGIVTGLLLGTLRNRRAHRQALRQLERAAEDLGTYYGKRDRESAAREAALLKLTKALAGLTAALVVISAATIVVVLVTA